MRLAAPVQLLLLAFTATGSTALPLAAPAANETETEVAARAADSHLAVEKRSYYHTCGKCFITDNISPDPRLNCHCKNVHDQWVWSFLDLNDCIANRNGQMRWAVECVPRTLQTWFLANVLYSSI
jgi:hypothetical protein